MSAPREAPAPAAAEGAIWQDVEFGSYAADLPLWVELARSAGGPVLELGSGAGRVSLHLAGHGLKVIAVERDPELVAELRRRGERLGTPPSLVQADLSSPTGIDLPREPGLAIAPLHVAQTLDGATRTALLRWLLEALSPGASVAITVVDESTLLSAGAAATQILPEMREVEGWVYSSEPLWVQATDAELRVRRLRERVSPGGEMKRTVHDELLHRLSPERLRIEAEQAGLRPAGLRSVRSGPNEADSIVVLLEAP